VLLFPGERPRNRVARRERRAVRSRIVRAAGNLEGVFLPQLAAAGKGRPRRTNKTIIHEQGRSPTPHARRLVQPEPLSWLLMVAREIARPFHARITCSFSPQPAPRPLPT